MITLTFREVYAIGTCLERHKLLSLGLVANNPSMQKCMDEADAAWAKLEASVIPPPPKPDFTADRDALK